MAWIDYFKTITEQLAMLISGTEEDGTAIPGAPLAASEAHIGEVGGSSVVKDVTFTLDTNAYASGDVLAEVQELDAAFRANGAGGVIQSLMVVDKDDQGEALDVVFFGLTGSLGTENSAVSISDSDAAKIQGIVEVGASDYVDLANSQVASMANLSLVVEPGAAADSLFVGLVSRGTGTYTSGGITIRIGILQD